MQQRTQELAIIIKKKYPQSVMISPVAYIIQYRIWIKKTKTERLLQ